MSTTPDVTLGARWIRAALQVNPYEYDGNPSPKDSYPTEDLYNQALLDACEAEGIEMIAITDHWKASSAAGLIEAAEKRGIVALPGFEANCKEAFHLLVIFESGTPLESITSWIGECVPPADDPHGPGDRTFDQIVESMTRRGAVVIPAHVNIATSGLLSRERGKPLEKIVQNLGILALGVSPGHAPMGEQLAILGNRKPYTRPHPLVEIYADDVMKPQTLGEPGGSSWFKMAKPSLAGIQHALRTPQTRVRTDAPPRQHGTRLTSISWTGGFLAGVKLPIGPELTALIGGRGTGKSTVIESLRFALALPPIGEDAARDHQGIVSKVLGPGVVVKVGVETLEPTPARYVIQRTVGDPPLVLDSSGTPTQHAPADVAGTLEIFGQHELAELSGNKAMLAQLVRRLGGEAEAETRRPALIRELITNRGELATLERQQEELEAALADLPRLKEQVGRYTETDLELKMQAQRAIGEERATFEEYSRRLNSANSAVAAFGLTALLDELRADVAAVKGGEHQNRLGEARQTALDVASTIQGAFATITAAIEGATTTLAGTRGAWEAAVQPLLDEHAATTRELAEAGYDPDGYMKNTAALRALELRTDERTKLRERRSSSLKKRKELLGRLQILDAEISAELTTAIGMTNSSTRGQVVVKPVADPDREQIKEVVQRHFRTPRTQIMAAIEKESFSVRSFVEAVRGGVEKLHAYDVTGSQASTLVGHGESLLRELEEHNVGLAVDVCLNVADEGTELRKLEDLSKGQRATALLLLLLGVASTPLVIDQPEDDLDNRFVYRGVVKHLRELKGERQLLVSTHNANVPVLGDAELIIVLESDGRHGATAVDGIGSLDESPIREYAERLLEGGEEAFRARRHLYGF